VYIVKGWGVRSTVSGEGKSSVQCKGKENKVYIVKGREIKGTVSREGISSVKCQGKGSLV
jgi:hypothetical protein